MSEAEGFIDQRLSLDDYRSIFRRLFLCALVCRREAEFNVTTEVLLSPAHAAQLVNLERLSLYGNKLERLTHVSSLLSAKALSEMNVSV